MVLKNFTTIGKVIEAEMTSEMVWDIWIPVSPRMVFMSQRTGMNTRPLRIMDRKVARPLFPMLWKSMFP